MNGKTARLLRRWSTLRRIDYRRAKKTWLRRNAADRAELRVHVKSDIALNTRRA